MIKLFPSSKIFIEIAGISIAWYAILIVAGGIIACMISKKRMNAKGYTNIDFSDMFINIIAVGLVGARLWYVAFKFDELYKNDLIRIFKIYEGGLAIQGGVIAGLIYAIYYLKKRNINILEAGDAIMPTVLLAQAIGRWGNFVNQEAYGQIMTSEQMSKLMIPSFIKEGMFIQGAYRQPTFLYESILNLLGFLLIIFVISKVLKKPGTQFGMYFIWYGITRFIVEKFRSDSLMFGALKMAQVTSLIFILAGVVLIIYVYNKDKKRGKYNV